MKIPIGDGSGLPQRQRKRSNERIIVHPSDGKMIPTPSGLVVKGEIYDFQVNLTVSKVKLNIDNEMI